MSCYLPQFDTQRFRMLLCSSNLALGMVFIIV